MHHRLRPVLFPSRDLPRDAFASRLQVVFRTKTDLGTEMKLQKKQTLRTCKSIGFPMKHLRDPPEPQKTAGKAVKLQEIHAQHENGFQAANRKHSKPAWLQVEVTTPHPVVSVAQKPWSPWEGTETTFITPNRSLPKTLAAELLQNLAVSTCFNRLEASTLLIHR